MVRQLQLRWLARQFGHIESVSFKFTSKFSRTAITSPHHTCLYMRLPTIALKPNHCIIDLAAPPLGAIDAFQHPEVVADMASGSCMTLTSTSLLNTEVNTHVGKMHAWKFSIIIRRRSDGKSLKAKAQCKKTMYLSESSVSLPTQQRINNALKRRTNG